MLRPDDLVGLSDFELGTLTVSPSRRTVERAGQSIAVEPRIMQMLVLLARERGQVVTRQTLFDEIWGGVPVGDDSLNRAAAGVRRALAADSGLELETIPRTGYRLVVHGVAVDLVPPVAPIRRRTAIAVGLMGLAVAGGSFWSIKSRGDEAEQLLGKGLDLLSFNDRSGAAIPYFRQAAEWRRDDARVLGLLAYSLAMRGNLLSQASAGDNRRGGELREAQAAIARTLELEPRQPDALLAQILLQRSVLDYATTEDRLRRILSDHPRHTHAMRLLWDVMQCVGRSRDALGLVERAIAIDPLSAVNNFPRAQLLWITGRTAEADRVIDSAMANWPDHPFVRFARYTIFAFTGRPRAALAMLDTPRTRPGNFSESNIAIYRMFLAALDQRTPAAIERASRAAIEAGRRNPEDVSQGVMTMAALGLVEEAFDLANPLFVATAGSAAPAKGTAWRFTPFLFTPPVAPLWTDPRFDPIADAAGLTDYWTKRGIEPDFRRAAA